MKCAHRRAAGAEVTIEKVRRFCAAHILRASAAPDMSSESKRSNRVDVQPTLQCRVREPIVCAKSKARGVAQRARIFTPLLDCGAGGCLCDSAFYLPIRGGGRCGDAVSLRGAFAAFFVGAKVLTDCACNTSSWVPRGRDRTVQIRLSLCPVRVKGVSWMLTSYVLTVSS